MCCWLRCIPLPAQSIQFQQLSIAEGLSHNHVTAIVKDFQGFMWFGTPAGLNRYDGHEIKIYRHARGDENSLMDNSINQLFLGPGGRLWVGTGSGFCVYDPNTDQFIRQADSLLSAMGIPGGELLSIAHDEAGRFYFLHHNGTLYQYDTRRKKLSGYTDSLSAPFSGMALDKNGEVWLANASGHVRRIEPEGLTIRWSASIHAPGEEVLAHYQIFVDGAFRPWVYAKNLPIGVYWWADTLKRPRHIHTGSGNMRLNNNLVFNIAEDQEGRVWLATDHGGINLLVPDTDGADYLVNDEFNDRSLAHNSVTALYHDREGGMWVGTFKGGLSYHHPHQIQFALYKHQRGAPRSIPFDDINRFVEDEKGNIWIGTNGGGLIYFDRAANQFSQYRHNPADPRSLGSDVIVSLYIDREHTLWVGTYHGGLNRFDGKGFVRYTYQPHDSGSISDNSVWEIYEDSEGRFWVGTLAGGLNLLDRQRGIFTRLAYGPDQRFRSSYISAIMEDHLGHIWIGTATGIEVWEPKSGRCRYYSYDRNNPNSLSNDYVTAICQDRQQRIWVATREGLNRYLPDTDSFEVFTEEDGLPENTVLTIVEDLEGTLWLSTSRGLSALTEKAGKVPAWRIRNYNRNNGLQHAVFNENAALCLSSGEVVFGGPTGFNIINPYHIVEAALTARPKLTDFQLFNSSTPSALWVGKDEIALSHDQDVLSFVVASLQFVQTDRVYFQYKLEGFDEQWLVMDRHTRKATYTNLDPGGYRFQMRVSLDNETWSEPYALANITIAPPFWKTTWAYSLYCGLFLLVLWSVRHIERRREKTRFALQREREEARRIRELDQLKTRFFTNVSHEFRTPINLILTPLDKLEQCLPDLAMKRHLDVVRRNTKRLLNLVNQLLDFRKMDTGALKPNMAAGDVAEAIREHFNSFIDLAESKQIAYHLTMTEDRVDAWFDPDKLERILFNLLSNAFKFTPVSGAVYLDVSFMPANGNPKREVTIVVRDTGIGIPAEDQSRIFAPYFQHSTPTDLLNQGSGIGLAIVKEYVQLLGGRIAVASAAGSGSTFTVVLPLDSPAQGQPAEDVPKQPERKIVAAHQRKRVLLVEDDCDFRFYLKDNLREFATIQEASDAREGWAQALAFRPDIIIADVSMPGDDGVSLCRRLKGDSRTKHIPVILVTAMVDESTQLAGINAGAADCITKPFSFELLRSKIDSLLRQKDTMEQTFKKRLEVRPADVATESMDERFMRKALDLVEQHMGDPDFSVERLSSLLNMSRVALYKKILALTGHTPSEFIRNVRLRRAATLLEHSGMNVAEAAYEVGFSSPKQFSRYFKALYNTLPSNFRKEA